MKKSKGIPRYLPAAIMAGMHIDPFVFKTNPVVKKKKTRSSVNKRSR